MILSVDYGDQRTGIAVCDPTETLASAVTVIQESYQPKVIAAVAALAEERHAGMIVVGLPKNMDASLGSRAQKCMAFAQLLGERTGLPVETWDERLTTVMAYQSMDLTGTYGKKRKKMVDAVSAVIILEGFMAYRKNHHVQ
ncbi:MAG: Holliday junction resolvase RuvX [Clostridia bacterium]